MELFRLSEAEKIGLIVAHSIQKEIDHPNTPAWVKRVAESKISTVEVNLSDNERKIKKAILGILAGAGNPETMRQDADHIYEASKYGSYFVTADERILKREEELFELCMVTVLKPSAVLEIYKQYEGA